MDLRSGHPYWLVKNGITATYPPLQQDLQTEVAIIGAGITGALVAYLLTKQGVGVVVLDKRDVAWGSTSACTALVQYEIDTNLYQLKQSIGEVDAVRAYRLGIEAIDAIEQIADELQAECHFQRRQSIYLARRKHEERALRCEYTARRQSGFDVSYLEAEPLGETYGIAARAAIVSEQAAELDPYLLTHQLLASSQAQGAQIFDRTEVKRLEQKASQVVLQTDRDHVIRANKVVFAIGYEVHQFLKQPIVDLNSTYAVISEPVDILQTLQGRYILWEMARPYFYLRSTPDQRIIVGGADEPFRNPERRDRLIGKKSQALVEMFARLYPQAGRLEVAYAWAGTFGETKDGLPYIGESPTMANAYFALGYGGNGVTYSMIAARIICDLYLGKANADTRLFRFDR